MFVPFDATARFAEIDRTDPDTLVDRARDLARRRAALDAEEAELLATVEELRVGGVDWFRDPGAWLRVKTGIAGYTARTRLTVARGLAVLPTVLEALREGRIGFDHVRVIADQADSPNRDNLLEDIEEILGWALTKAADDFRDAVAGWARDLDERREVGMTDHQRQLRRRKVTRSRTKEGLRRTVLDLDDETDSIVYGAVRDIVADMLRAEKKADLRPETRRATRQIWADAFGELARRSRGADVITRHKARPVILAMTEMSVLRDQLKVRGSASSPMAPSSPPARSAAWPARPTSSPWSWTPTASVWTWAAPFASPPTSSASPSGPCTPPVRSRAATWTSTGARSTTSAPGNEAGTPTSTTSSPSAPTTTI